MPKKVVQALVQGAETQADAEWAETQIKAALANSSMHVTTAVFDEDLWSAPDLPEDVAGEAA